MVANVSNCYEIFRTKRAKTNVAMYSFIMRDVHVCIIYFRDTSFELQCFSFSHSIVCTDSLQV